MPERVLLQTFSAVSFRNVANFFSVPQYPQQYLQLALYLALILVHEHLLRPNK